MKIIQVRFKNLNSLPGEWSIDFTHPAYAADGIFAIIGPTGAGKTTILDAVCLALYGATPRLGKVTAASNEIMTRHTGECFAEVTFETSKSTYRCHWSQHRARRSPAGAFQGRKHEISDAATEKILESRVSHVVPVVQENTGMAFDQFTRSMMLAQGAFAAFLQADPDERAPILEQITRTEIYSRISIKAHERWNSENQALSDLKAKLEGLQLLTGEETAALKAELIEKGASASKLSKSLDEYRQMIAWLDNITGLEKEIDTLKTGLTTVEHKQGEFRPKAERLERANRAIRIKGDYVALTGLRNIQANELKSLEDEKKRLPELEQKLNKTAENRNAAANRLERDRAELKRETDTIKRVRELDFKCAEKLDQIQKAEKANEKADTKRKNRRSNIAKKEAALKKSLAALDAINIYLEKQAGDSQLAADYPMIRKTVEDYRKNEIKHRKLAIDLSNALKAWKNAEKKRLASEKAKQKADSDLAQADKTDKTLEEQIVTRLGDQSMEDRRKYLDECKERKNALIQGADISNRIAVNQKIVDESVERRKGLEKQLARLEQDLILKNTEVESSEKEIRSLEKEISLLSRIRDLQQERKRLEDGKPCPLCGSKEHPFAEGNVPAMGDAEAALEESKQRLKTLAGRASALNAEKVGISTKMDQLGRDVQERKKAIDADQSSLSDVLRKIDVDAELFAVRERLNSEIGSIEARIIDVSKSIQAIEDLEKSKKKAAAALAVARDISAKAERSFEQAGYELKTAEQDHLRIQKDLSESESGLNSLYDDIRGKLSGYQIDTFEIKELETVLEALDQRRNQWNEHQKRKNQEETSAASLKTDLENRRDELKDLDEACAAAEKEHLALKRRYDELIKDREALYGKKDPDEEEQRIHKRFEDSEQALETIRIELEKTEREVENVKSAMNRLIESTGKRYRELYRAETEFKGCLENNGFPDETAYLDASISDKEHNELKADAERLNREKADLETRLNDKTAALKKERDKQMTDRPKEVLLEEKRENENALETVQHEIGATRERLAKDQIDRDRRKEHIRNVEQRRKECSRWEKLRELIGSHDGKKFRNFAQSLTLEMMVGFANRQLTKMTDRYFLIRNEDNPLELSVVDNYQAGEIRSTKNLSGGESFIVSMALALGLSHLSSRNVRVDSLFLDEGFGTLDEDALETALATLGGLRRDGKLIGLISHVSSIRDRITTQIQVIPQSGGRSALSGPGVRRIGG